MTFEIDLKLKTNLFYPDISFFDSFAENWDFLRHSIPFIGLGLVVKYEDI